MKDFFDFERDDEGIDTGFLDAIPQFSPASDLFCETGFVTPLTPQQMAIMNYVVGIEDGEPHSVEDAAARFGMTVEEANAIQNNSFKALDNQFKQRDNSHNN